jgi:RNA-binding protein
MPDERIRLKGFQRRYLRAAAHPLKPVILIGQKGVSPELVASLEQALDQHELVKVKFIENKNKADKTRMIQDLQNAVNAELAGTLGHTAIFYRESPDPKKRRIILPQKSNDSTL